MEEHRGNEQSLEFLSHLKKLISACNNAVVASNPIAFNEGATIIELDELGTFINSVVKKVVSATDCMIGFNLLYQDNRSLIINIARSNEKQEFIKRLPEAATVRIVKKDNIVTLPVGKFSKFAKESFSDVNDMYNFALILCKCMFYSTNVDEQRRNVGVLLNKYEEILGVPILTNIPEPTQDESLSSGITNILAGMGMKYDYDEGVMEEMSKVFTSIKGTLLDEQGSFDPSQFIGEDGSVDLDGIVTPLAKSLPAGMGDYIKSAVKPTIDAMTSSGTGTKAEVAE